MNRSSSPFFSENNMMPVTIFCVCSKQNHSSYYFQTPCGSHQLGLLVSTKNHICLSGIKQRNQHQPKPVLIFQELMCFWPMHQVAIQLDHFSHSWHKIKNTVPRTAPTFKFLHSPTPRNKKRKKCVRPWKKERQSQLPSNWRSCFVVHLLEWPLPASSQLLQKDCLPTNPGGSRTEFENQTADLWNVGASHSNQREHEKCVCVCVGLGFLRIARNLLFFDTFVFGMVAKIGSYSGRVRRSLAQAISQIVHGCVKTMVHWPIRQLMIMRWLLWLFNFLTIETDHNGL